MKKLVEINKAIIGKNKINAVDARELWKFLGSKRQFGNWIKKKIKDYNFEENTDFFTFNKNVKRATGASIRKEYTISINMAKELSMLEKTKIGKEARNYFINCEKELKQIQKPKRINPGPINSDVVDIVKKSMTISEIFGIDKAHAIYAANLSALNFTGIDCLLELGNPDIQLENKTYYMIPTTIGKNVNMTAQRVNLELENMGLQKRVKGNRQNVWTLTDKGKEYAIISYVGKKNNYSNTPVTQIKWDVKILDLFKEQPVLKLVNE